MNMEFLKLTGVNLNQPWTAILEDLQKININLLDRIGTCQDKEHLWKLKQVQEQVESICVEIDQRLSTGVSLEPTKANNAAVAAESEKRKLSVSEALAAKTAKSTKVEGKAPSPPVTPTADGVVESAKAEESTSSVSASPKADGAVSDTMKNAMSNYMATQSAPKSEFKLDSTGKI